MNDRTRPGIASSRWDGWSERATDTLLQWYLSENMPCKKRRRQQLRYACPAYNGTCRRTCLARVVTTKPFHLATVWREHSWKRLN